VRGDGADDAVERRGDLPIAGAQRDHQPALVHLFAEPLGEAALADAGVTGEQHEAVSGTVLGDLRGDLQEARALGVARDEGARAQAEQAVVLVVGSGALKASPAEAASTGGGIERAGPMGAASSSPSSTRWA
jgi:hypothetical protein